jgi:hypothetical protein
VRSRRSGRRQCAISGHTPLVYRAERYDGWYRIMQNWAIPRSAVRQGTRRRGRVKWRSLKGLAFRKEVRTSQKPCLAEGFRIATHPPYCRSSIEHSCNSGHAGVFKPSVKERPKLSFTIKSGPCSIGGACPLMYRYPKLPPGVFLISTAIVLADAVSLEV